MSSFSTLNTALSALRYQQSVLDVSSTNVANASTDGYVRRQVNGATVSATSTTSVWSRSSIVGNGVTSTGVQRTVDLLLDRRVRQEHAKQGYLDLKSSVLARVETGLAEPGDTGVASALSGFGSALADLSNDPSSSAARSAVLSSAQVLSDAINLQATNFANEAGDQRVKIASNVDQVNSLATQLASTNQTILAARTTGADVSTLLDTRDKLALQLAELSGAVGTVQDDGTMTVTLNDATLVEGRRAGTLSIASGITADNQSDGSPITFDLTAYDGTTTSISGALGGELGAGVELIDDVFPAYMAGLNEIVTTLADSINAVQEAGYDADGNLGTALFTYDPDDPAGTLSVAITSNSQIAASSLAGGLLDGSNASAMANAITVADAYQRLINEFGTTVNTAAKLASNQATLTTQVDNAREQLTGVSIDEETVNMVAAQRAYEAAARVMTTVDDMLDTLINRTGRVGL